MNKNKTLFIVIAIIAITCAPLHAAASPYMGGYMNDSVRTTRRVICNVNFR